MNTDRLDMENALKEHCVPLLKSYGFKGGFPNLYRELDGFVSLINFQFYSSGGGISVNVSFADKARNNIYFRPETEPKKLRVSQTRVHARLGAQNLVGDHWFIYGKTSSGEFRGIPRNPTEIATEVNRLLEEVALPWWEGHAAAGPLKPTPPSP